ncbi:MAG TPA: DUF962 domain-containing protein [Bryobacteraceae bacterium]|jgi:uncharacterized membrane protein YGL010W
MMANRSWEEWIAQYETGHQHPVNRACHTVGIPAIAAAVLMTPLLLRRPRWWPLPAILFAGGWTLQFVGHAFEGKPPEFFHDYRFLFVGLRWWLAKAGMKPSSERL